MKKIKPIRPVRIDGTEDPSPIAAVILFVFRFFLFAEREDARALVSIHGLMPFEQSRSERTLRPD